MQHAIPVEALGTVGETMAHAVSACVHCGFCLPQCPTYRLLGEEMDSPRGRIVLMKEVLEGALPLEEAAPYLDRCLGCVACVPACPSGVPYGELVTTFRALAEPRRARPWTERAARRLLRETLPHTGRFRAAARLGRLVVPLKASLPAAVRPMLDLLPANLTSAPPLPAFFPAQGPRRARVALLTGCVQQVLAPAINWATLRVLARNGVEVVIPVGQGCCGALALHSGDAAEARRLTRHNLAVFPTDVDAIISNAAGCGSGMKEAAGLFKGQPEAATAAAFGQRVKDITAFLDELGLLDPPPLPQPWKVAYHDACHLAHAQGVREAPRRLLGRIPNLALVEMAEGDLCCGSAGTYNLEQPALAGRLGQRKVQNFLAAGADALAAGNIGCLMQIQHHLQVAGRTAPLYHTVQLLDLAYQAEGGLGPRQAA